jgi:hypothetical protein
MAEFRRRKDGRLDKRTKGAKETEELFDYIGSLPNSVQFILLLTFVIAGGCFIYWSQN